MHAHLYLRAARFAFRGLANPLIRPWLAALVAGVGTRLLMRHLGAASAGLAILAGWAVLTMPGLLAWPPNALGRLPWAAVLLLAAVLLEPGWKPWPVRLGLAAVLSWWLRGTPIDAAGFAACVPVFFGLLAALPLAERLGEPAGGDPGWARAGAGVALAGALWAAGASSHWVIAALVPAVTALVFVGLPEPSVVLARALVVVGAAAILATDRGRLAPVDAAGAAPFAVWLLAPRLTRLGPAGASLLAAAACIALAWAAAGAAAHR